MRWLPFFREPMVIDGADTDVQIRYALMGQCTQTHGADTREYEYAETGCLCPSSGHLRQMCDLA